MELRPNRILCPVDLSEPAKTALEAAKVLAAQWRSILEVVYIYEFPPTAMMGGEESGLVERQWKDYRRWVVGELEAMLGDIPKSRRRTRVHEGVPAAVLGRILRKGEHGLVVMGTHGYTGLKHVVFGSVAESVVRVSKVPVLTIPLKGRLDRPRRILVPYNMTAYADAALRHAMGFADRFGGTVTAVFVADDPQEAGAAVEGLKARIVDALGADEARRVASVVREDSPDRGILEEAVSGRHDLVVLSAHRKVFWKDMILGMTAERVLRHSPIPVLCIPSQGRK